MKTTVQIHGLKDLERALGDLPQAAGRAVLRRAGIKAISVVISAAKTKVPVDSGKLRDSLKVSTRLSKRQQQVQRKAVAQGKASVEIYAGAEALPYAHLVEFGTKNTMPRPFMRPAWDEKKGEVLDLIKGELGGEITKAAARLARRRARQAARGK